MSSEQGTHSEGGQSSQEEQQQEQSSRGTGQGSHSALKRMKELETRDALQRQEGPTTGD